MASMLAMEKVKIMPDVHMAATIAPPAQIATDWLARNAAISPGI